MAKVFLNGELVEAGAARVSVSDAGLQQAVGLFETVQVVDGQPVRLAEHLQRMAGSAGVLGLAADMQTGPLGEAVRAVIDQDELRELAAGGAKLRVRLTVTAGVLEAREGGPPRVRQTVVAQAQPAVQLEPRYYEQGVMAVVHGPAANPFDELAGHKTLDYWARLRSLRRAASAGAAEAIWLQVTNHLAGGSISNLLLVKDGAVLTPIARGEEADGALPAPVVPGLTRAAALRAAAEAGLEVQRRMLNIDDLLGADEAMLTNGDWGVLPLTKVEKHAVGDGQPGPVTRRLMEAVGRS
jgi:branched-subunit amino acid aminotransferase/4-amino-4-deoxychorismate lyase